MGQRKKSSIFSGYAIAFRNFAPSPDAPPLFQKFSKYGQDITEASSMPEILSLQWRVGLPH
jgi:hypothetical protein